MRNFTSAVLAACFMTLAVPAAFAEGEDEAAPKAVLPGLEAAPPAAPQAACLVSGPGAKTVGCAGAYQKVSDGFLEGYKAMDAWVASASEQVSASAEKVEKIEEQIKANESEGTGLKLQRSKEAKLKLKEIDKANKQLWKDLDAARREQDALCKGFSRAASTKVKELVSDVTKRLSEAQKTDR